ncbi:nucleoside hydrolase [Nonomuraea sp. NN258]|uniref:nucleoside hydrolase n=1 Tax=Nonomuraea antri TaxID=2730852 RepID=UPI001569266B|nr:nucleoside hydrolase [Nonomuraea antri]NRQ31182.1 nucleoside hydrolase [Nonomuraea antri]
MKRKVLAFVTVLATLGAVAACSGTPLDAAPGTGKIIIDADMGELNDDAQALFLLAAAPGVELLGVTTVGGNTWPEEGTAYALRQLELIGRADVPVVTGETNVPAPRADYDGALDRPRPASHRELPTPPHGGYATAAPRPGGAADFLAEQVKRHPGEVTVFALGPATNLARAVKAHPETAGLVKEVVFLGAGEESAEFNRWFDPAASKDVFAAPFRSRLVVPLAATERLTLDADGYRRVTAGPETPVKRLFKQLQGPAFAKDPGHRMFVWDAVAAAVFLRPDLVTDSDGRTVLEVDEDRFWDFYTSGIG